MRAARSVRILDNVCLVVVALGLSLPFAYYLPTFALYRDALADYVGDSALAEGSPTLTWCLLDSARSLFYGAWANVAMINGIPLLLVVPLFNLWMVNVPALLTAGPLAWAYATAER